MEQQTTKPMSRDELLRFLDYMADKGLMKRATVQSRKAAVNTLLSILTDEEAADLQGLDIDHLIGRFHNIKGDEFKPASLRVYKSRLNSVVDDYTRYRREPLTFKPQSSGSRERSPRSASPKTDPAGSEVRGSANVRQAPAPTTGSGMEAVETIVFPIPIRKGVIVRVSGIPSDLTPDEAEKIGNVILALSGSQEPER
jgi:hypothetical protein